MHADDRTNERNDGTDPKKNDADLPVTPGGPLQAKQRQCRLRVTNKTGVTLKNVALTHKSGPRVTPIRVPQLLADESSYEESIVFETGGFACFDYWNISFNIDNTVYGTPNNDRCNISYEDAGKLIDCEVLTETPYFGSYTLRTGMPASSSCKFKITKNGVLENG